jgi:hypothetical protein
MWWLTGMARFDTPRVPIIPLPSNIASALGLASPHLDLNVDLNRSPIFNLTPDGAMHIITLLGMLVSTLVLLLPRLGANALGFGILWACYLSLLQVGQTFLSFQWDILLLEAGFISILVAPLWSTKR